MLRPAALVFDLDGTLIDSRRDITTAINRMRADLGRPPLTLEQVVTMVGEGAKLLVFRALGGDVPEQILERALSTYLEHYRDVCLETTQPYPGVEALLESVAARYPMALLSNKGEALSRKILDGLNLSRFFREILGGDSLPTRKPDPGGLLHLARRLQVPPERLLMVGDTWVDAVTARNAGCPFGLVEWGFPRTPAPEELQADLRTADPDELRVRLLSLSGQAPEPKPS
ncbi:MAG TPA: HAD-IA family hydrolase [Thermoanaerobaculia bacterium]|nr:HAD-IA family hydrolase [bacterium]HYG65528.1 HAD-IA family hydrolase [Thermoanaerobaculia bacterium]